MRWWLSVFFLVNGTWVPGHEMSPGGWSPRAYDSLEICSERKKFAEEACKEFKNQIVWYCSEGAPIIKPPPEIEGKAC
jgi:hypothetical protein